jgi:hypothetical protein
MSLLDDEQDDDLGGPYGHAFARFGTLELRRTPLPAR